MIAARYASLLAFAQARGFCATGEGGGVDNSCGGDRLSVSQKEIKDAWGKESYELEGETLKNFSYTLEDKQTGGLASLKVSAYHDYSDGDFSPKATEVNIVSWHATPLSEIAAHGLAAEEGFKGKGFGRAVMKEALRIADEHKATVLSIFAPSDDSQAVMKHYTETGLLEPILSSKAVYGDYFTSFKINKEKAAEFAKRKPSKRAFCPRGEGNGIDNSCGSKTMSAPDRDGGGGSSPKPSAADTWGDNTWATKSTPKELEHLGSIRVMGSRKEPEIAALASSMGIAGPAELLTIGACNLPDAKVQIDGIGTNILLLRTDVPAGDGKIKIDTALTHSESGSTINYGYLALDEKAQKQALADPGIQTKYAGKIIGAMVASMEAAEKAGFVEADTHADGYGPGNTNGRRTDLQGYRLWGRFGFDGEISRGWFTKVKGKGVDVHSALSPEDRDELEKKGSITLQQLLKTKQGEKIWKQWGVPIELTFDFKNKESTGYQRFQKMVSLAKRAKQDRALFFEFVAGLEMREDPALWSGFVEERAFCPNGEGKGVTNTCGKGIGINDADQDFTGQILAGKKTIETRRPNSLKPYIGKTVGIVRTGKGKATLVGVMKVGEPKFYKTRKEFDADFDKHRVGKDSVHYIGPEGKYGYPLSEVKPVKPRVLSSQGRVARVIANKVKTRDLVVEFDLDAESPEEPNAEARGDAPAPKKDQVKGSDVNKEGSAKNKSGDISLDESTISSLKKKVEEHNAAMREAGKPDWTHVRLPSLKAVYRRGSGAFSTSHRPGMARDQWAMARVNAFLTLARRGRPENAKYTTDNDLLHSGHPKHSTQARAFCATGEGNGIDNSCGGGTFSEIPVTGKTPTLQLSPADNKTDSFNWEAARSLEGTPDGRFIQGYTAVGSQGVNDHFRYLKGTEEENEAQRDFAESVDRAIKSISQKANPEGKMLSSFRGLSVEVGVAGAEERKHVRELSRVQPGDIIKEDGIFSTSANLSVVVDGGFVGDSGILFRVRGRSGAPINSLSRHGGDSKFFSVGEAEVAYPHATSFKVRRVTKSVTVGDYRKVTVIDIDEVK
jgi:GNAT superfamily N-acetyltransferase